MNIIIFSLLVIVIVIAICIIFMLYMIRNKSVLPRNNDIGTAGIVEHFGQYDAIVNIFKQNLDIHIGGDIYRTDKELDKSGNTDKDEVNHINTKFLHVFTPIKIKDGALDDNDESPIKDITKTYELHLKENFKSEFKKNFKM